MGKQLKLFDSISSGEKTSNLQPKLKFKSNEAKELQELVEYHQHLYYNGQPEITDKEFDELWDKLKVLDPTNEVFTKIGADFDVSLNKISFSKYIYPHSEFVKFFIIQYFEGFLPMYPMDAIKTMKEGKVY